MRYLLRWVRKAAQQLAIGLGITLASFLFCFLALEFGLRARDGIPLLSTTNFVAAELDQVHRNGSAAIYDPQFGWVQREGIRSANFNTGEFGARVLAGASQTLRKGGILVVGDSFAVGSGVSDNESWPAYLANSLNEQVVNAAVGGYGLDQTVLRAEFLAPKIAPKIIIVQSRLEFGVSVSRMNFYGGAPKPYFTVEHGALVRHNNPVPRLGSSRVNIGLARSIFGHSYLVQFVMTRLNLLSWWVADVNWPNFVMSNDEGVQVGCALMQRLANLRDKYSVRVIMLLQYAGVDPIAPRFYAGDQINGVVDCAQAQRIEVIDTLDSLRARFNGNDISDYQSLWQMSDNNRVYGHMSADGNKLVSELIVRYLRSKPSFANPDVSGVAAGKL